MILNSFTIIPFAVLGMVNNGRRSGGYLVGVARDILHNTKESSFSCQPSTVSTIAKEEFRDSASLCENHKDSYFLRVEGYPVPHVLNEDCECVLPQPQRVDFSESISVNDNSPPIKPRSSIDNVSILAHLGSVHTIAGRRRGSPLSSDTWNQTDCSDSTETRNIPNRQFLTPCIEYSSSDGASNLLCRSCSTLEDALAGVPAE